MRPLQSECHGVTLTPRWGRSRRRTQTSRFRWIVTCRVVVTTPAASRARGILSKWRRARRVSHERPLPAPGDYRGFVGVPSPNDSRARILLLPAFPRPRPALHCVGNYGRSKIGVSASGSRLHNFSLDALYDVIRRLSAGLHSGTRPWPGQRGGPEGKAESLGVHAYADRSNFAGRSESHAWIWFFRSTRKIPVSTATEAFYVFSLSSQLA